MSRQQGKFNQQASQPLNEAELSNAAGGHQGITPGTYIFIDQNGNEQSCTINKIRNDGTAKITFNQG
ncbi:MAG: hypothetical protein K0S11_386 [Gammaproteobacteria bacterium]|jgi:hypothetical protein|nr:hypothetical protein [Gammaproteobacteria bacterium]